MAFSRTWDLEKYKSEFESDEHWELRKKFMQAHKDQIPEEKLVCLARVFCNIEFLGCRYPEETMKLVAELSKGVADDYREKQKGKLKRTFVQASDAAGAKVKGRGATPSKISEGPPTKIVKTNDNIPSAAGLKNSCSVHEGLVKPAVLEGGEFPGFIIYESCKTNCPINILTQSAQKSKTWINFLFPAEKNLTTNQRCCEVTLNKKLLASGFGTTSKEAKVKAAVEGLNKLRQTCYTIQEKLSFFSDGELVSKEVVKEKNAPPPLLQNNIGSKMMMKMGWTGAGLGKNQQGIQTPIEASQTMHRAGFGCLSTRQFQDKFRDVFKDYIASGSTNDLVFAPDFSADERKLLHSIAQKMNLKTKSHGKDEKRHLVVYRDVTPRAIVENLLVCGGENEKYLLHYPRAADASNSPASSKHVVVEKENPNISVKTITTDSTKDNVMLSIFKSNSQPHSTVQHREVSVEKSSVCQKGSLNVRQKSVCVPETVFLSSDDDTDPQSKLQDHTKSKRNVTSGALRTMAECDVDESEINVINKVIEAKKEEIINLLRGFEKLLDVYNKKKCFTKQEERLYFFKRRRLQNVTGTFILDVLRPHWTIEDWKRGKIPASYSLTNFNFRSEAIGLAELENNIHLKQEVLRNIKMKLRIGKLFESKRTRRELRLQCREIGSKLVSDVMYNNNLYKKKPKNCIQVKRKFIPKEKGKSQEKKKNQVNLIGPKTIDFVKENGVIPQDDLSGVEDSEAEIEESDVE